MSEQPKRGISCQGLDAAFEADETHKSSLIAEGHFHRLQGQFDEAANKLAEAAEIEERLAEVCEAKGLIEKSWVHWFSAANCWAQAGNFFSALRLGDAMLARGGLPDRLQRQVQTFTQSIRRSRARLATETELTAANAAG